MKTKYNGFTLVELIIVVVILGLLASIGFVSYTGYLEGVRDSNRITQSKDIHKSLQIYATNKYLPLPDNYITVTASGTTLGYQGYAGKGILSQINFTNGGVDPLDNSYFTYFVSKNKKDLQMVTFLEEDSNISEETSFLSPLIPRAYAADLSNRYPKSFGDKLGVILEDGTKKPIQDVASGSLDVIASGNTYQVVFSDTNSITGSGSTLSYIKSNSTCERIQELGGGPDGYYTIQPGDTEFNTYCDMSGENMNLMEVDWSLGTGDDGKFKAYSTSTNSNRVYGETHLKAQDIIRETTPTHGGRYYNIDPIEIDPDKTYRVSTWMKKTGTTSGTSYFGGITSSNGILNISGGAVNNNPYFWYGDLPELDTWYLVVGYIHKSSHTDTVINGGVYDVSSRDRLVSGTGEFKFDPTATIAWSRVLHYNDPTLTNRMYFYAPRFEEIDDSKIGDVSDILPILE